MTLRVRLAFIIPVLLLFLPGARAEYFLYDAAGGLVRAVQGDGTSAQYAYDAGRNLSATALVARLSAQIGQSLTLTTKPTWLTGATGKNVRADLSALGGNSNQQFKDDGTNGDAVAGDGIYSTTVNVGSGTATGPTVVEVTATDANGNQTEDFIGVNILAPGSTPGADDTPTLPEWGMILLGVLLLWRALRSLPGTAKTAAALLVATTAAHAQDYPMWENIPLDMATPPRVSGEGTVQDVSTLQLPPSEEDSQPQISTLALSTPASIDAEVAALASSLGDGAAVAGEGSDAKAIRIFNWVHNNIDSDYYYGLRKGSALTLLENSGNDFDQSVLLRDLLIAAGYPASSVKLVKISHLVDYESLKAWFGLADEPFPGKTYQQVYGTTTQADFGVTLSDKKGKQARFAWAFLKDRGAYQGDNNGTPYVYTGFMPGSVTLVFDRLFVALSLDGGASYTYLDPAAKEYTAATGINLLSGMGYSRSGLLTQAAGSSDTNTVSGLSETNVASYMAARSAALLGYLNANALGTPLSGLVGGRTIVKRNITSLAQGSISGFYLLNGITTFNSPSDSAFASLKSTVTFQSGGINYSLPTSDLKGRKISLTFSGNTAELRLDDGSPVATTTVTGTSMPLTVTVTHPGNLIATSETKSYLKNDAYAYAIVYGFNAGGRLLQKRYEQLKAYKDAGKADDSREVKTEILNIMGLTWLYQTELAYKVVNAQNRVLGLSHHRFGRMAQEKGFYIDVGLQLTGNATDDGVMDDGRYDNSFHLASLFASAMEHGIIQQMQKKADGTPYDAVSTVNIVRAANKAGGGQTLYLARSSNWNSIKGSLSGYDVANGVYDLGEPFVDSNANGIHDINEGFTDQTIKQNLEWLINNRSAQLFLPKTASVTQGIWTGTGWVVRSPSQAGMIISGGYSGGYSTNLGTVSSPKITTSYSYNPVSITRPSTISTYTYSPPPATAPKFYASDPVDMATGAFTYQTTDLATGTEDAPRGISFSRQYSSNLAARDDQHVGYGWTTNLDIRASARSATEEALGLGNPQYAASFLASMLVAADLYRTDAAPKEWGTAALVVGWQVDQMRDGAVSVRMGKDAYQFLGQPDGSFLPPPGSTLSLTKQANGTYQMKERLGNTYTFDSSGQVQTITDPDGLSMTFAYNTDDTLNYVQDSASRRYTFGYTGGRITLVTDSTGRSVSFAYDANGNLTSSTDPEGKVSYFDYTVSGDPGNTAATDHRIVRLRNHDGETITQSIYDSLGRVYRQYLHGNSSKTFSLYYTGTDNYQVDPKGGVTHFYYDDHGRAVGTRDPNGGLTAMTYDSLDRVTSKTSASGETTVFHYDANSNVTGIDYPRGGGSSTMTYDGLNRISSSTDPNGVQTTYAYFSSGQDSGKDRPQTVTTAGSVTTYQYMPSGLAIGRVWKITDGDGLVTENAYDGNGQLDWTKAPGGFTTNYLYTARGDLDNVVDPNGAKTQYTYNKRRQVTNVTGDSTGIAASEDTTYDNQGRVATRTLPADQSGQRPVQSFSYSPTDKVRTETLAGVAVATRSYDERDWESGVVDAGGRSTAYTRNGNGTIRSTSRVSGRNSSYSYDGDGRVTASTDPGNNSGSFRTGYSYSSTGSGPRDVFVDSDGGSVVSDRDRLGKLRFLTDKKGAQFEFRYDSLGRRTHVISPGMGAFVTGYTNNGRIASETEPSGDSASYSYNSGTGRLASVTYSGTGGGTVNFTSYDADGRVLALNENGSGAITRSYDGLGRVTSYSGPNGTIGYRYYPSGRLAKLIYPGGNDSTGHVEYTYYSDGRLKDVIDRLGGSARTTTYSWYSDGRLASITRPNGSTRTMSYDGAGRATGITESAGGSVILQYGLTFYASDDIRSFTLAPSIPMPVTPQPAASMAFNQANQLTSFNGAAVSHDADGNMVSGPLPGGTMGTYSYDSRNRLVAAGGLTYSYDAEGNRIGIGGNETTSFVVDPNSGMSKVLLRVKNGVATRYVYGVGLLYEVNSSNVPTYYHFDQSGNTAAITSNAGLVVDRAAYSPYGLVRSRLASYDTPFLYGGAFGVATDANGLVHMRARYYNPLTCRFVNSDPARDKWNWYAYASGDPINNSDPLGTSDRSISSLSVSQITGGRATEYSITHPTQATLALRETLLFAITLAAPVLWEASIARAAAVSARAASAASSAARFSRVGGAGGDLLIASEDTLQVGLRDPALYGTRLTTTPTFNSNLSTAGRVTGRGLNASVDIGPTAFSSRSELIQTIIHEEAHIRLDLRSAAGSPRALRLQSDILSEESYVEKVAQRYWQRFGGR